MQKCAFCDVTEDERNKILLATPLTVVLMANQRKVPGQLLVVPKRHVERLSELSNEERKEIFEVIVTAEKRIIKYYGAGCDVTQHYKPYLDEDGFKVNHLHFHVLPRYKGDSLDKLREKERILYKSITEKEWDDTVIMWSIAL